MTASVKESAQVATATEHPQGSASTTPSAAALPPIPEPGQVVKVRGSTWAVSDVRRQGLPRSPADEGVPGLTHVVSLQSLDEDRLGQELTVVWELEIGHTVAPNQGLPKTVRAERKISSRVRRLWSYEICGVGSRRFAGSLIHACS
ncbi:hypothetical protein, partial [Streptomyces fagopyri]|uniref:hypothetical protein n=1 Tax=Streptomyces fagopyri TaxID=2662397 RepID=UPI0033D39D03